MSTPSKVPHPWLTVVMPSYRGEEWIGHALSSLAAEAADGIEVLLIDGGPTPAARDIHENSTTACRYASSRGRM